MIENCLMSGESTARITPVNEAGEDIEEEGEPAGGHPSEKDGKENKRDEDPANDPEK